ncbi:MAG: type II secretion system protein [Thermodesulfobacteriota bacterium]
MRRMGNIASQAGLTLVELAIVLVVLGLVVGMTLPLLSELSKQRHHRSTQRDMEEIKESLVGYAVIHGRLPWSDTTGDGVGDTNRTVGALPFLDLGLGAVDAWRSPYRYDVNDRLTNTNSVQALCAALSQIASGEPPGLAFTQGGQPSAQAVVALSGGENSRLDGENGDGDRLYEALAQSDSYDDLVIWISPSTLAGRLNCAGAGGAGVCATYSVINRRPVNVYVRGGSYVTCTQVPGNGSGSFTMSSGHSVDIYLNLIQCQNQVNPSTITFPQVVSTDADGDCQVAWTNTGLQDE